MQTIRCQPGAPKYPILWWIHAEPDLPEKLTGTWRDEERCFLFFKGLRWYYSGITPAFSEVYLLILSVQSHCIEMCQIHQQFVRLLLLYIVISHVTSNVFYLILLSVVAHLLPFMMIHCGQFTKVTLTFGRSVTYFFIFTNKCNIPWYLEV